MSSARSSVASSIAPTSTPYFPPTDFRKVHVSDDPLGPVESDQPKSAPTAVPADLLRVEPAEFPSLQSLGDPPDDGGLADPGYARQQQDAPGNHSALLRRLRIEGRESPCDLFAFAFRALRFGRLVLGDALALVEDLDGPSRLALLSPIIIGGISEGRGSYRQLASSPLR